MTSFCVPKTVTSRSTEEKLDLLESKTTDIEPAGQEKEELQDLKTSHCLNKTKAQSMDHHVTK